MRTWVDLSDDELRSRLIERQQPEGWADFLVRRRDDGPPWNETIDRVLGDQ